MSGNLDLDAQVTLYISPTEFGPALTDDQRDMISALFEMPGHGGVTVESISGVITNKKGKIISTATITALCTRLVQTGICGTKDTTDTEGTHTFYYPLITLDQLRLLVNGGWRP